MDMKIKVCGMTDPKNVKEVLALKPDYIGFIFHPGSSRFVDRHQASWSQGIDQVQKVGVFVNAQADEVLAASTALSLDAAQLHGNESPEVCMTLKSANLLVIKAFGIHQNFNWERLEAYHQSVDYFLFDTASAQYGGSGISFDWELLKQYPLDKSYFLSGGISPANLSEAQQFKDERLYALDLNSKFEDRPGIKNITVLKQALALNI